MGFVLRPIPVVVLLAALLTACASSSGSGTHRAQPTAPPPRALPAATVIQTYTPYGPTGEVSVHVTGVRPGECWTTSIAAAGSPSAFRCRSGNQILDPCFAASHVGRTVACVDDPWSDAVVLHLRAALPTDPPMGDGSRPWALQLRNGLRCVAATGTVPTVAGVDLAYRCTGGSDAAVVGPPTGVVIAAYGRPDATTLHRTPVVRLWRG